MITKAQLKPVVDQLIKLGEDQAELTYWLEIFDDLPQDKQQQLYDNLSGELAGLQAQAPPTPTPTPTPPAT